VSESRVLRRKNIWKEEVTEGRRKFRKEFHNLIATPHYQVESIKKNEMGGACSTNGRDEKCIQNVYRRTTWKM
jgi:hypothetical protein